MTVLECSGLKETEDYVCDFINDLSCFSTVKPYRRYVILYNKCIATPASEILT